MNDWISVHIQSNFMDIQVLTIYLYVNNKKNINKNHSIFF